MAENLTALLDSSSDMIMAVNLQYKLIYFNRSYADFIKQRLQHIIEVGQSVDDYLPADRVKAWKNVLAPIWEGQTVDYFQTEVFWEEQEAFEFRANPIHKEGKLQGCILVARNQSHNYRRRRAYQRLAHLMEQVSDSVVLVDREGIVRYWNDAATALLGIAAENSLGRRWDSVFPSLATSISQWLDSERIAAGEDLTEEWPYPHPVRGDSWINSRVSPYYDEEGHFEGYLCISHDITRIKQAQLKAEQMNRLKTNILANLSHELRTPLNGIIGLSQLLQQELGTPRQQQMVQMILNSGYRLEKTLIAALELATLEAENQPYELESLELNEIAAAVFNEMRASAFQKELGWHSSLAPQPLNVLADRRVLEQILIHLLGNAVRFTEAGSIYLKTERVTKHEKPYAVIEITDTGIGIAEEHISRIFEPFIQESEGLGRNYEGNGLGLAIVDRYIQILDGHITLESEKGMGSKFCVWLPLNDITTL